MKNKLGNIPSRLGSPGQRLASPAVKVAARQTANARGYGYQWQVARAAYLLANPLCVRCYALGLLTPAVVVDHVTPHRGDMVLFWNETNWQGLCVNCHAQWKQQQEQHRAARARVRARRDDGCDVDKMGEGGGKVEPPVDT